MARPEPAQQVYQLLPAMLLNPVLVNVPVLKAVAQSPIASAQPTHMPHLVPMTILEHAQLVTLAVQAQLAVFWLLLACVQPTPTEIM
jgi:hypothetical protein